MTSNGNHVDHSDDEPENVSFVTSKQETVENMQKIKDQITQIRESQKIKRKQRQQMYIEQKKQKLEKLQVPVEVLNEVEKIKATSKKSSKVVKKKRVNSPQKQKFIDDDLSNSAVSDFIPLKSYKNYGISVVNLSNANKKPLISSESAKTFKSEAFNRKGIRRQTSTERLAVMAKRKTFKSLNK